MIVYKIKFIKKMREWLDRPAAIVVSRFMQTVINMIIVLLIARTLGPSGRGEAAATMAVLGIAPTLVGLGIPSVVRRQALTPEGARRCIATVRSMAWLMLVPSVAIGFIASQTVLSSLDSTATIIFIIAAICTPLIVLWNCDSNVLYARGQFAAMSFIQIISPITLLLSTSIFLVFGHLSVATVLFGSALSPAATLAYTSWKVKIPLKSRRESRMKLIRQSVKFVGAQLASTIALRLDVAIALPIVGAIQLGFYSVATSIAQLPIAFGYAYGAVVFQKLAKTSNQNDCKQIISEEIRRSMLLGILTSGVLALITPMVIPVLFGPGFVSAIQPTWIALIGSIGLVCANVFSSIFIYLGQGWTLSLAQTAGAVLGLGAIFVFAPMWASTGLAIASTIGYLATAIWCGVKLSPSYSILIPDKTDIYHIFRGLTQNSAS